MPITQMNGLPLQFAVICELPGRRFLRSSHTSVERCRGAIVDDLKTASWGPLARWTIIRLVVPMAADPFAPIPAHTILEGPYSRTNPPALG